MLTIHVRYNNRQFPEHCSVCGELHQTQVGFVGFAGATRAAVCDCCIESANLMFHRRMKSLWREVEDLPFHAITGKSLLTLVSPKLRLLGPLSGECRVAEVLHEV